MRRPILLRLAVVCLALMILSSPTAAPKPDLSKDEARLLRFPALSADSIAFVYAGDLWIAPRAGGIARQLTTDAGIEWFPRFSPDGRSIAFTGEYDGNRDVFVIPAEGGEPKRLTWWRDVGQQNERAGPNNMVMGWTRDGGKVLFRSRHQAWESRAGRLFTVGIDGGLPEPLIVPEGGQAAFSPDGNRIVYNRIFRNFRTWKRYRGGMTQNLWIYDLKANTLDKLTDNDNTSVDPMWIADKVYFTSDREHTSNLYSIDLATKQTRRLTDYREYDVRWASDGPGGIVYENGGWIYLLDLATGKSAKVSIRVPADRRFTRPEFLTVSDKVREYGLSPEGKRAVLVARGDIFTVPAEKGNTRDLTNSSGAHDRGASWSPDGKWIAYLSDVTGEYEVWLASQDGKTPPRRLTTDGDCYRFAPAWSPDSKKLALGDKNLKLFVLDVETQKVTQADKAKDSEITDYVWSHDSRWLAYSKQDPQGFRQVFLYSLDTTAVTRVTSEMTDSYTPAFDPKGRYLYLLSNRDLNATLGFADTSYVYERPSRVYAITLRSDLASPFAPESDEVKSAEEKKKEEGKKDDKSPEAKKDDDSKKPPEPLKIDLAGIEARIVGFPIESGDYDSLKATPSSVLYMSRPATQLTGGAGPSHSDLKLYDMDKRKEHTLLSGIDSYDLSPDVTKVIYDAERKYGIVDAKAPASPGSVKVGDGALKLDGLQMKVDHRAEWQQIFDEVWRLERDFFYAPNMHGVDWQHMKEKYGALVPYVAHRSDLTYILGELIGELSTGHTYVGGGEAPRGKSIPLAMLGADYELDAASGRYRIARVLEGQNWVEKRRSPLTEPGSVVAPGSYLLQIDGVDLKAPLTPDELLENKTDRTVTLLVGGAPADRPGQGAREVTVKPISDEEDLRYYDRIEANRRKVDSATGGRVAYVHIPDMGGDGLNEFVRQFYPQIRKEGLIIDVRNNGGGFVSEMILERLRRVLAGMGSSRNAGESTYPAQAFYGPMVCLINQYSASDGDIFPYYFKKYALGPLIGTRTWGGVVGIRDGKPLLDGGYITQPEFGSYGLDSQWVIEGHGVDPDIEVDNRDDLVVKGRDPQLEKGIEVVLDQMKKNPRKLPPRPAPPVKN